MPSTFTLGELITVCIDCFIETVKHDYYHQLLTQLAVKQDISILQIIFGQSAKK